MQECMWDRRQGDLLIKGRSHLQGGAEEVRREWGKEKEGGAGRDRLRSAASHRAQPLASGRRVEKEVIGGRERRR